MKKHGVVGLFLFLLPISLLAAGTLDFYIIDVDHGNAVLAVSPSGQSMLLDAGPTGQVYTDRILAAMREAGVSQLDYAVISHYHWDHYGTIPDLAGKIPIKTYVDHGTNVEADRSPEFYQKHGGGPKNAPYERYLKAREKGNHVVVKPGDKIPFAGTEVTVVSSAGQVLSTPLPGAKGANPACWLTGLISEDELEDAQSVGLLIEFGKFRFVNLGDLTWNISRQLFCPENKVGRADVYIVTHHGLCKEKETAGEIEWSTGSCPPCEVYGLKPRVAILTAGEDYVARLATPEVWQRLHFSPGLEDIWQTHYLAQGGPANNAAEEFIACWNAIVPQGGDWIKVSAGQDGSFSVTNKRNGFAKRYPVGQPAQVSSAAQPSVAKAGPPPVLPVVDPSKNLPGMPKFTPAHTLAGHGRYVSSVAFSPDGTWLATGGWDGTARLWEVASGKHLRTFTHHQMAVTSVAFSPDGRWLAVGSDDTTVTLWETGTGRLVRTFDYPAGYVLSVAFSPDGRRLAISTAFGRIEVWDVSNGEQVAAWVGHSQAVYSVLFSPDGTQLVSGGRDATIKFWTWPGAQLTRTLTIGPQQFHTFSLSFSRDGRSLAAGATGGEIRVFDVATGECAHPIRTGNTAPYVRPVAFAPDGRWVVAGNGQGLVQFWSPDTGDKLGTLNGHTDAIESAAVSPDGRWLATGSDDNTAMLWRLSE